jgi:aspartate beta-hydroxylase
MTSDPFLRAGIDAAHTLLMQGDAAAAEPRLRRLLETHVDHVELLNLLAMAQIRLGQRPQAMQTLQHALAVYPDDPLSLNSHGLLAEELGDRAAALASFSRLLVQQPGNFAARLHRGRLYEALGERHQALVAYSRALNDARAQGRWISDATTSPALRDAVLHAVRVVRQGTRELFAASYAPLQQQFGAAALKRVETCLLAHLGERPMASPDPRQQPTFLYFPGLPPQPYFAIEQIEGLSALADHTANIRAELEQVLVRPEGHERVFLDAATEAENLKGTRGAPRWNGFYFYRHGVRHEDNARACPRTAAALDAQPLLARVPGHAPETLFSVFAPGTHLLKHRGVTNTRLVAHLPLIVPPDCALSVAGEAHHWREGELVAFDDTYEHEAWNRSDQTRVVLILDLWNPHLTEVERAAVSALVVALGDFREQTEHA